MKKSAHFVTTISHVIPLDSKVIDPLCYSHFSPDLLYHTVNLKSKNISYVISLFRLLLSVM
jgi:hypothetical protein